MFSLLSALITSASFAATERTVGIYLRDHSEVQYNSENIKFQSIEINAQTPVSPHFDVVAGTTQRKTNFQGRELAGSNGERIPLTTIDNGQQTIYTLATQYRIHTYTLGLSYQGSSGSDIFKSQSTGIQLQRSFYNNGATLTYSYSQGSGQFATGYFIQPTTLVSEKRRNYVKDQSHQIQWEQILNERLRGSLQALRRSTQGFRPTVTGLETQLAYVLTPKHSLHFNLGHVSESTTETLTDDRGYFAANWLSLAIGYAPRFDHEIFLKFNTLMETENDPRRSSKVQLGTDAAEISYRYMGLRIEPSLSIQLARTSQNEQGLKILGGILWKFE